MELKLKSISPDAIAAAIAAAEHYRNLNEPSEAESICRDILLTDETNQTAMRLLGLSLTDQFTGRETDPYSEAERVFAALEDAYERFYYTGMLRERRAKAELRIGRASYMVTALLQDALKFFEEAEKIRPAGNDEAILRWNHCVRLVQSRPELEWMARGPES
jgi:tetratricopeptide (TPR) repeat protein